MKRLLTAAILFVSCAHEAPQPVRKSTEVWESTCGMRVETELFGHDWVQNAENATLLALAGSKNKQLQDHDGACAELRGTVIRLKSGPWWETANVQGRGTTLSEVIGLTVCAPGKPRVVYLAMDRFIFTGRWQDTSLPHEIVHVIQHCTAHLRWREDGINSILDQLEE